MNCDVSFYRDRRSLLDTVDLFVASVAPTSGRFALVVTQIRMYIRMFQFSLC